MLFIFLQQHDPVGAVLQQHLELLAADLQGAIPLNPGQLHDAQGLLLHFLNHNFYNIFYIINQQLPDPNFYEKHHRTRPKKVTELTDQNLRSHD